MSELDSSSAAASDLGLGGGNSGGAGINTPLSQSHDEDWTYLDNGRIVYRASCIGGCITGLTASRMGETAYPAHASLQKAMDASSDAEALAVAEYEKRTTGHTVVWRQKTVCLLVANLFQETQPVEVRGHIDGLDKELDVIVEIKSLSGRNFALYDSGGLDALGMMGLRWKWQAAIYGHATKRNVRWVVYNKHAESEEDLLIIEPPADPSSLVPVSDIAERVSEVERFAHEDRYPDCDRKCGKFDAYAHVHFFPAVSMGDEELEAKLQEYYALKILLKGDPEDDDDDGLLGKLDDLAGDIKQAYQPGTHIAGDFKAQIVKRNGTRFDSKAFKRAHPETYEEFTVPSPSVSLTVTKAKRKPSGESALATPDERSTEGGTD